MAIVESPIRARTRYYSDLDLGFKKNPNTNDLARKFDAAAVKQSIRNIILTRKGEKPFDPNFGSNVSNFLFEQFDSVTRLALVAAVENSIQNYEPRVELLSVEVNSYDERNAINIILEYRIKSPEGQTDTVEIIVERIR